MTDSPTAYPAKRILSFISWQRDGHLLSATAEFYRLTGYSQQDTQGLKWPWSFTTERSWPCILSEMGRLDRGGEAGQIQAELVRHDGSTVPIVVEMGRLEPNVGQEPVFVAFVSDLSEVRRELDELLVSKMAIDLFSDSSLWVDEQGRLVYVNRRASETLGYTEAELKTMHIWDVDPDYSLERYRKIWGDNKAAGWLKFESVHRTKEGKIFPVEVKSSYVSFRGRELLISFDRDISERRRADEALLDSEELFRVLTKTSQAAVFLVQNNKFIYANPQGLKLLGYNYDEIVGESFLKPLHPDFKETMREYGAMLLHGERIPGRFELKFQKKSGEEGWCDVVVAPIRYRGMAAGVITALDITDRKKSEIALKESEEKFRVLSEMSPVAIFMYQSTRLIYANPAAIGFTGFNEEEILTKSFWDMVHPRYREMVKQYGLARLRGEPVPTRYEIMYLTKAGEARWAEFTAGEFEYRGEPAGIVTAIDVTQRKTNELALTRAKQEAELYVDLMGHDINNMNQIALGFLELLEEKLSGGGRIDIEDRQIIASAIESLKSSSNLILAVRKLQKERKGGYQSRIIDVDEVLSGVKAQFAKVPGREVTIDFLTRSGCKVRANELLKDVFINIVGNAIKHSRGDLSIFMTTGHEVIDDNSYCRVEITDTGPGIPDEKKKAIFDRSRKERGMLTGRGLGLYLVRTLVDDYHGQIWVEDRIKGDYREGCRFVVLLPSVIEEPESADGEAAA